MIKPSKRTKEWQTEKEKLKKIFIEKGIDKCEIRKDDCWIYNALGFVHRHKRIWYYSRPGKLGSFNQVLLGCNPCHQKIENNKEETERIFMKLRGKEL